MRSIRNIKHVQTCLVDEAILVTQGPIVIRLLGKHQETGRLDLFHQRRPRFQVIFSFVMKLDHQLTNETLFDKIQVE